MSAIPRNVDPVALLQELGLQVQEEKGDEIYARCPGHLKRVGHIDHDASWSVNVETGEHHCFSCGYGGTLYWLIAQINEWHDDKGQLDTKRAQRWLQRRAGESFDMVKTLRSTMTAVTPRLKRKVMDESRLALFVDPPDWALQQRALLAASAKHYGVRWDNDYDAWILPIRDPETNKLWGWQLKGEGADNRVFRNRPPGVKKAETVFGLHRLDGGTAVLLESPLDAVRLHTVGIPGGVATYGAAWTDKQLDLICQRADRLIVALDNDAAGQKAALQLMGLDVRGKRLEKGKDYGRRIDMAYFHYTSSHKDIGEMEASDIIKGLSHARSSVRGVKAVL